QPDGGDQMRLGCGMVVRGVFLVLAVLGALSFGGQAWADPIGPGCGSCFGGVYTLTGTVVDADTLTIVYTADMTGHDAIITDIDQMAFKVAAGGKAPVANVTFDSFTVNNVARGSGGNDAEGNTGLSSAGCKDTGKGGAGFVCSEGAASAVFPAGKAVY